MEIENFEYILCRFYCIIFFMFVNKKVNEKEGDIRDENRS